MSQSIWMLTASFCISNFLCLLLWSEQNAISHLKIAQSCWGSAPHERALSGTLGCCGKAKLYVWWGVYHWKTMKIQGVDSWTALYFVVQGHCVSLRSPLSLGESHNVSGLKWRSWTRWALEPFPLQASTRTEARCFLVGLTCIFLSFGS